MPARLAGALSTVFFAMKCSRRKSSLDFTRVPVRPWDRLRDQGRSSDDLGPSRLKRNVSCLAALDTGSHCRREGQVDE